MSTKIIKFNIGGCTYEVSKSQLDSKPNTMLARSASDQWLQDSKADIFIDRDGSLFKYVLSYLRDGRVDLPLTVSKKALMQELIYYYGFENVCEDDINDEVTQGVMAMRTLQDRYRLMKEISRTQGLNGECETIAGALIKLYLKEAEFASEYDVLVNNHLFRKLENLFRDSKRDGIKNAKVLNRMNHHLNKAGLHLIVEFIEQSSVPTINSTTLALIKP